MAVPERVSIVLKLVNVALAAKDVADRPWGTSCSELECFERIAAMDRLRAELEVLSHGAAINAARQFTAEVQP